MNLSMKPCSKNLFTPSLIAGLWLLLVGRVMGQIFMPVTHIAAGGAHSLFGSYTVLRGSLWAMGLNLYGQLGDGTTTDQNAPEVVASASPGTPVTASAGGGGHSLFIRPDGSLWGMGANDSGQLG